MIEHVGHEYMDDFFGCCEYHLAEHGLLVLQVQHFYCMITIVAQVPSCWTQIYMHNGQSIALPEELYDKMRMRPEFLKTYIFPGGCLPSLGRIVSAMSNASRLKYVLFNLMI
jgi:cyclopropane-fatty-acyl-phospholipid synthase